MNKLTKEIKAQIVANVLRATSLPQEREALLIEETKRVKTIFSDTIPTDFAKKTKGLPAEWFCATSAIHVPVEVCAAYILREDETNRRNCHWHTVNFSPIPRPSNHESNLGHDFMVEHMTDIGERANDLKARIESVTGELMAFLNSCRTTKAVLEKMPSLAPHVPVQVKYYPLAVSTENLLSKLTHCGFDMTVAALS